MVDALQVTGYCYGALGAIYAVSREVSFSRWIRLHGIKTRYGYVDATIHEKESKAYFLVVGVILGAVGLFAFEIADEFVSYSGWVPALIVNIPFILSVTAMGHYSQVLDINGGSPEVYPIGSVRRFMFLFVFTFAYPIASGLCLGALGLIPFEGNLGLNSVFVIPFFLSIIILCLPLLLGGWLFGTEGLVDTLPYSMKTRAFRMFFPVCFALFWVEVIPATNLPLLVVGFVVSVLLLVGLARVGREAAY